MARKTPDRGLGKGLDALFGPAAQTTESGSVLVPIEKVEASLKQPRKYFDDEALQDLADSIRIHGILQPITVRRLASGYYQIISGERRWRAARIAQLAEVPVLIIEADDRKAMELGLIENLQREDLNPMEEAQGYCSLIEDYGLTQEEAAQRVGKSRPAVANALRLLALPQEVVDFVTGGFLSAGHARAILGLKTPEEQVALAQKAVSEELSVRQVEALVKRLLAAAEKPAKAEKDPNEVDYAAAAERDLGTRLGRRVHIVSGKKKGKLELEYYGMDDLNDLLDALAKLSYQRKEASEG